jgi:hypothetical protein
MRCEQGCASREDERPRMGCEGGEERRLCVCVCVCVCVCAHVCVCVTPVFLSCLLHQVALGFKLGVRVELGVKGIEQRNEYLLVGWPSYAAWWGPPPERPGRQGGETMGAHACKSCMFAWRPKISACVCAHTHHLTPIPFPGLGMMPRLELSPPPPPSPLRSYSTGTDSCPVLLPRSLARYLAVMMP